MYDTWTRDNEHCTDYVVKWDYLSNDFMLYRDGEKIIGNYSNNVYSASAEYGRKKSLGNDRYV